MLLRLPRRDLDDVDALVLRHAEDARLAASLVGTEAAFAAVELVESLLWFASSRAAGRRAVDRELARLESRWHAEIRDAISKARAYAASELVAS